MVKRFQHPNKRRGAGYLTTDLVVALGILSVALLPVSYGFQRERKLAAAAYYRAVAMEIVDGELEALRAGEWRSYPEGTHTYAVTAEAATNLPSGGFQLVRSGRTIRLEWRPLEPRSGSPVAREAILP